MKISDLIEQLEQLKKEHGDLRVTRYEFGGVGVINYTGAQIKDLRAKRPRELKRRTVDYSDRVSVEKVCLV